MARTLLEPAIVSNAYRFVLFAAGGALVGEAGAEAGLAHHVSVVVLRLEVSRRAGVLCTRKTQSALLSFVQGNLDF